MTSVLDGDVVFLSMEVAQNELTYIKSKSENVFVDSMGAGCSRNVQLIDMAMNRCCRLAEQGRDVYWIIDDVDYIISFEGNKYEEKILNLINIIKTSGKNNILMTSRKMPRFLDSGLKDLISRISSATVIEMRDPDEILLKKIIEKYLNEKNIQINNESLDYLINRIERSYKSALKFAKMIDIMSLEKKTKINKPFLKSILN